MRLAPAGRALIQGYEHLAFKAYSDQGGIPTIGWGHTGKEVYLGLIWTEDQCEAAFDHDVGGAEAAVNGQVHKPLTQNQFDACVAFCFNVGVGNWQGSTLLKELNQGQYAAASQQFPVWNKVRVDGVLTVSNGLISRRAAEKRLFLAA